MTKKFDRLVESILNEMMPADFGGSVGSVVSKYPAERKGHFKPLSKLTDEEVDILTVIVLTTAFPDDVPRNAISSLIDKLKKKKEKPSLDIDISAEMDELKKISNWKNSEIDSIDELKSLYRKGLIQTAYLFPKLGNVANESDPPYWIIFLADRLASATKQDVAFTTASGQSVEKEMTQKQFKQALKKSLEDFSADGNGEEDEEEDLEVEAEEEVEKKASYNPRADYYLKTYEEMPSGKLSGDARVAYDRLSGMSGEVHSGADFVKELAKSGLGARQVNQLLDLGVLEPADEEVSDAGDTEGFKETEEDYIERITRAAREDFRSSDLNPKYGGIQFD